MFRRTFLQNTALTTIGASILPEFVFADDSSQKVRLGFIGVGLRGRDHLEQACYRPDVAVVAICDIDPQAIAESQKILRKFNRPEAVTFQQGPEDFLNLLKRDDIDGVLIATPWHWHVPQAVAAMKAAKYVGLEVPAALSVKECWELVRTHEQTGSHLMFLENVCYRRDVIAVLNMVRQNLFGEMMYAHCGYQHDLRHVKFNDGKQPYGGGVEFGDKGFSEAKWRTAHSVNRNGDLYPTHGIGPVATWLDINRGNRFVHLTATATKTRGLHNYIVNKGGETHPNTQVKFKLGDIVTTTIQCANGENVVIMHDTNLPRPYSLGFRCQGTKGLWEDEGSRIYIEGKSPEHRWEVWKDYQTLYDHPVWKRFEKEAENAGHGGMDFFVLRAFIESVKRRVAPPIDVYDAATWSVISPLSEKSIAQGSRPQQFPDFTQGKWKSNQRIFGFEV